MLGLRHSIWPWLLAGGPTSSGPPRHASLCLALMPAAIPQLPFRALPPRALCWQWSRHREPRSKMFVGADAGRPDGNPSTALVEAMLLLHQHVFASLAQLSGRTRLTAVRAFPEWTTLSWRFARTGLSAYCAACARWPAGHAAVQLVLHRQAGLECHPTPFLIRLFRRLAGPAATERSC